MCLSYTYTFRYRPNLNFLNIKLKAELVSQIESTIGCCLHPLKQLLFYAKNALECATDSRVWIKPNSHAYDWFPKLLGSAPASQWHIMQKSF